MVKWRDVELPGFSGTLASVPVERRDTLLAHLRRTMPAQAPASPGSRWTPAPIGNYPDACSACGGFCCRKGGDIAFLNEDALRIVWRDQPRRGRDEMIAAYMDRIPEQAFERSCIFHAAQGCNLPHHLRSVVCNTYLCAPLKAAAMRGE